VKRFTVCYNPNGSAVEPLLRQATGTFAERLGKEMVCILKNEIGCKNIVAKYDLKQKNKSRIR